MEKAIEKQTRQAKQLADKKRHDEEKHAREQNALTAKEAIRNQASMIIRSQQVIDGFRVMDATS